MHFRNLKSNSMVKEINFAINVEGRSRRSGFNQTTFSLIRGLPGATN